MSQKIEITDLIQSGQRCDSPVKNLEFIYVDNKLRSSGWVMLINEERHLAYAYPGEDLEYYDIEIFTDKVYVSFPLKNIPYQCHLWLDSVEETVMYMERHYEIFMKSKEK